MYACCHPVRNACRQPAPADPPLPAAQVLALTMELQQLGGGDVAVGSAWTGITTAASATAAAGHLDAAAPDWASLSEALDAELRPWLRRGFGSAVLLLGGPTSSVTSIATAACADALGSAGRVGVSWQLLSGGVVRDPVGRRQQLAGTAGSRRPSAAPRPASRLGTQHAAAAAAGGEDAAEPCTILACTPADLSQLLEIAQAQLQAAAAPAAAAAPGADLQAPPALLLHLSLAAADGRPSAALHLLHLPAPQGVAAEAQQEALLRMLREAADLHQRRREGEHAHDTLLILMLVLACQCAVCSDLHNLVLVCILQTVPVRNKVVASLPSCLQASTCLPLPSCRRSTSWRHR